MSRALVLMLGLAASVFTTASAQGVGTPRVGAAAPAAGSTLYVSSTGSDADGFTPQTAFRSVAKAVTAAASGATISIAAGRYVEAPLMLTKSLTLSGPQAAEPSDTSTDLKPLPPIDTLCATRACIGTDSGDRVINISAATSGPPTVTLANLVILGPDMSKRPAQSSFGIVVDAVPVTVQDVTIVAGVGGPGGGGTNGETPATPGSTPTSGGACQRGGGGCECRPGSTGFDGMNAAGQVAAKGGTGGGVVLNYCPRGGEWNLNGPPNGATGGNGDAGPRGSNGVAAKLADAQFTRRDGLLAFRGAVSGAGGPGVRGGWGGGGGPGGTRAYYILGCVETNFAMGGDGGPGGVGGVPGTGASGGSQGGGAFGLTVADATVNATRLGIYGGKGGPGGPGGQGGAGGAGTKGGTGSAGTLEGGCGGGWHGGTGGKGGDAGDGGAGGGGAGGNGGPSIDVVLIGSAKLGGSQPATRGGSGGGGGGGGAAGPDGPLADGGGTGQQESSAQYTLK